MALLISKGKKGIERATRTLRQSCLTTSGLAKIVAACGTEYNGLRVREDSRDGAAASQNSKLVR